MFQRPKKERKFRGCGLEYELLISTQLIFIFPPFLVFFHALGRNIRLLYFVRKCCALRSHINQTTLTVSPQKCPFWASSPLNLGVFNQRWAQYADAREAHGNALGINNSIIVDEKELHLSSLSKILT